MNEANLGSYLSGAARRLVGGVAARALAHPRQAAFLARFGRSLQRAAKTRAAHATAGRHVPLFLIASIASTCNLACKGCYARAGGACAGPGGKARLSAQEWGGVFGQAAQAGIPFVLLAGGEPMMETETLRRAAAVKDVVFPVFTNGTLLEGEALALFDENRNLVPILSIEGGQARTDERRGGGVYAAVRQAMERLAARGMLFGTSITVTTENRAEVTSPAFLDKLQRSGCKLVFYVEYVPMEGGSEALAINEEARDALAARCEALRSEYPGMVFLSFPGDEEKLGGCLAAGRGFFHISPYGDAEPCPFSPYSAHNLRQHTLLEVLASPFFGRVREIEQAAGGSHTGGCVLFRHSGEVAALAQCAAASTA